MILDLMNKEGRKENSNPKKRERELYSRLKRRSKLSTNLVSSQNESNRKSTRTRRNWNSYLPPAPTPIWLHNVYVVCTLKFARYEHKYRPSWCFYKILAFRVSSKSRSQTPPSLTVHNGPKSFFCTFFLSCTTISNILKFQKKLDEKLLWNCRLKKIYKFLNATSEIIRSFYTCIQQVSLT